METMFGAETHQKANANKNNHKDIEIVKKVYENVMSQEINEEKTFEYCKEQHELKDLLGFVVD